MLSICSGLRFSMAFIACAIWSVLISIPEDFAISFSFSGSMLFICSALPATTQLRAACANSTTDRIAPPLRACAA